MNKLFVCIVVLAVVAFAAVLHGQSSREPFSTVGVDGFAALADSSGVQLVDVRTDAEYSEAHLPGAMLIDVKSAGLTAWPHCQARPQPRGGSVLPQRQAQCRRRAQAGCIGLPGGKPRRWHHGVAEGSAPRGEMRLQSGGRSRIERDKATVRRMIELYCRRKLGLPGIVGEYAELADYAMRRLERCRFGEGKPACKNCPVHCYSPARRTQIRRIMRWAGPRMLIYAPLEALRHLLSR